MASADPTYEVRATRPDGSRMTLGPFRTHREASDHAHALLSAGALRVATLRRVGGRVELLGIIGRPNPPERGEDDPLRPRRNDGGVIW